MSHGRRTQSPPASRRVTERPGEQEMHATPTAPPVEVTEAFRATTPRVVLAPEELNASDLDHRDYFVISLLDGITTVDNVLDICGMPSDEAIALLRGLERRGIISFER